MLIVACKKCGKPHLGGTFDHRIRFGDWRDDEIYIWEMDALLTKVKSLEEEQAAWKQEVKGLKQLIKNLLATRRGSSFFYGRQGNDYGRLKDMSDSSRERAKS